jgi:hypothetical protein
MENVWVVAWSPVCGDDGVCGYGFSVVFVDLDDYHFDVWVVDVVDDVVV